MKSVGVIGGGTMGAGIAEVIATEAAPNADVDRQMRLPSAFLPHGGTISSIRQQFGSAQ